MVNRQGTHRSTYSRHSAHATSKGLPSRAVPRSNISADPRNEQAAAGNQFVLKDFKSVDCPGQSLTYRLPLTTVPLRDTSSHDTSRSCERSPGEKFPIENNKCR